MTGEEFETLRLFLEPAGVILKMSSRYQDTIEAYVENQVFDYARIFNQLKAEQVLEMADEHVMKDWTYIERIGKEHSGVILK